MVAVVNSVVKSANPAAVIWPLLRSGPSPTNKPSRRQPKFESLAREKKEGWVRAMPL